MMKNNELNTDYKLIPMSEITEEARQIAVLWGDNMKDDFIVQKHKLASDIMNYAKRYSRQWTSVKDKLPDFDKTVWLYFEDTGHVALGVLAYIGGDESGYCWANYISGSISSENGRIVVDCDYEDIDPSHWIYVPELPPTTKGEQG